MTRDLDTGIAESFSHTQERSTTLPSLFPKACAFAKLRRDRMARQAVKTWRHFIAITFQSLLLLGLLPCASESTPAASFTLREGGIIRGPLEKKQMALVFTGHTYAEGAPTILDQLKEHRVKGSFFVTGDFLSNTNFHATVQRIIKEQHYLGPHSDKHLLYCPWEGPKRTLVTRNEFRDDLKTNLKKLQLFGVPRDSIRYFLPPFEHYNQQIVDWSGELKLQLVNYTPGTRSNADYTGEADRNFVSSDRIFDSIMGKERTDPHGLNGFILLLHIGAGPGREDKFSLRLGELLDFLQERRYAIVRIDTLLEAR